MDNKCCSEVCGGLRGFPASFLPDVTLGVQGGWVRVLLEAAAGNPGACMRCRKNDLNLCLVGKAQGE